MTEFGSRAINPMELYHNQVTRAQGPFSLRMFHRSWGIMLIQTNISAPCTVLDFPTREAFARELRANQYDIVGISSIIVNVGKVREMCRMVRESRRTRRSWSADTSRRSRASSTWSTPITSSAATASRWMRRLPGRGRVARRIQHPQIVVRFGTARHWACSCPSCSGSTAATIIPSVGCPMGCNFCTTSSFFGGKGKHLNFFDTGEELFEVMSEAEQRLQGATRSSSWTRISCCNGRAPWNCWSA